MAQNRWIIVGIATWLGAVGAGLAVLADYAAEPGMTGEVPSVWPDNQSLALASDSHTIVLAVHPRCPCTRSTIDELDLAFLVIVIGTALGEYRWQIPTIVNTRAVFRSFKIVV